MCRHLQTGRKQECLDSCIPCAHLRVVHIRVLLQKCTALSEPWCACTKLRSFVIWTIARHAQLGSKVDQTVDMWLMFASCCHTGRSNRPITHNAVFPLWLMSLCVAEGCSCVSMYQQRYAWATGILTQVPELLRVHVRHAVSDTSLKPQARVHPRSTTLH